MKLIVLVLTVFVTYAAAAPATENVYYDIAMNILRHPSRGRIVGGQDAEVNQFPHQVSLRWRSLGLASHICGGSIISEYTILTAGHCRAYDYGHYDVVLGLLNRGKSEPIIVPVDSKNWKVHENFPGGGVVAPYDIAVIVLEDKIPFSEAIQKIELGSDIHADLEVFDKAIVSGWGLTSSIGGLPNHLKYVEVPRITNSQCYTDLKTILSGREPPLDDSMICISNSKLNYLGTCGGDSGGCLFVEDNGVRKQIGVVSWGISPCGTKGSPSVFTDTHLYVDWIKENWRE